MTPRGKIFMIGALIVLLCGCGAGGGTEFGNPTDGTSRVVTGEVESVSTNIASSTTGKALKSTTCAADILVAANSKDEEISVVIASDCTFSISLPVGKVYRLSLEKNDGTVVGVLQFQNHPNLFTDTSMAVSKASSIMALGRITLSGSTATPATQPASLTDQDGDGIPDITDPDDDNDGIPDTEEADCDLDGFIDDHDDDNSTCTAQPATAHVLRVSPRHDFQFALRSRRAPINEPIRARVSCVIDSTSITAQSFRVTANNDVVTCVYNVPTPGRHVECTHTAVMLSDTTYTATLSGVRCLNGETVETRSWSWKTQKE